MCLLKPEIMLDRLGTFGEVGERPKTSSDEMPCCESDLFPLREEMLIALDRRLLVRLGTSLSASSALSVVDPKISSDEIPPENGPREDVLARPFFFLSGLMTVALLPVVDSIRSGPRVGLSWWSRPAVKEATGAGEIAGEGGTLLE